MQLIIKRIVAAGMGYDTLAPFGIPRSKWDSYIDEISLDLAKMSDEDLGKLEVVLATKKGYRGVGILLADVRNWIEILKEGATTQRARTVRQFSTIFQQYMLGVPGHRVYRRHDEGAMLCYYVNNITYNPPSFGRDGTPASVSVELLYEDTGNQRSSSISFGPEDCIGQSPGKALADKGYVVETQELRQRYLEDVELWLPISGSIGKQYWAYGRASRVTSDRYEWRSTWERMEKDGAPSRVVIDVFTEGGENTRGSSSSYIRTHFWANIGRWAKYDPEKDEAITPANKRRKRRERSYHEEANEAKDLAEDDLIELDENDYQVDETIEVPKHPWLVVFHLGKHLRLKLHVRQLREYVYDKQLADKLVLPQEQKDLVKLLIDTKGGVFQDIVAGKGSGAVILLSGEPGTGKTLTAEVYAESEERALYSVQCAQLGTNPDKLEETLLLSFERARRWNAVMLLDEADVYVHERGNNINQNAIVGVFLRVLEYQSTILFLTTNRPNDVDDAIASRCIARLHYKAPNASDASKIWQVLSRTANVNISHETIKEVVLSNPDMTGRDIKNILKLASLMPGAAETGITPEMVNFVKQFKPTGRSV